MPITNISLKAFICGNFYLSEEEVADDTTALFSSGLLDSFNLVELISHIESETGIKIGPLEISLQNFDSIKKIIAFVNSRR